MFLKLFLQKTSNLVGENKILKFTVLVIGAAVVYGTIKVETAISSQRTILMVPGLTGVSLEIGDREASDDYLVMVADYLAGLRFNYTPANVRKRFDSLLIHFDETHAPEARTRLYQLADQIETVHGTSAFFPNSEITIDPKNQQIEIRGLRKQWSQDIEVTELSGQRTIVIPYKIQNGRFLIGDVYEKAENQRG